jgi:hypothetical protein
MFNGCNQSSLVDEFASKETNNSGLSFRIIPNVVVEVEETDQAIGLVWGDAVDGLRAAVQFIPEKESYSVGERVEIQFHVQNVSDLDIQIASSNMRQGGAAVQDEDGNWVRVDYTTFSGRPRIVRHILQPDRTVVLKNYALGFGNTHDPALVQPITSPFVNTNVQCAPGDYFIHYNVLLPDIETISYVDEKDNVPQPNDWQGYLIPGVRKVTITPRQGTADKRKKRRETLSGESLEESLSNLYEVDWYYFSGSRMAGCLALSATIPLDRAVGQRDINLIVRNCRFLKIYPEMSSLRKEVAEALVNQEIRKSFYEYQSIYEEYMNRNSSYFNSLKPPGKMAESSLGFQISDNKDGSPTLMGIRFKVLSLVLLAGNMRLEGCRDSIKDVVTEAVKLKDYLYNDPYYNSSACWSLLQGASLYNRQILATGILGTRISEKETEELLESLNCYKIKEKLSFIDDEITWYYFRRMEQYSESTVEYVNPIEDTTFDLMLQQAGIVTSPLFQAINSHNLILTNH